MKYRIKQIDDIFYAQYKKFIFWKNYSELQTKEKQSTDWRQTGDETFCRNKKFNSIDNAKDFLLLKIKEDSKKNIG
jgi:hypothetical protein